MTIPADSLPSKHNSGLDLLEGTVVIDLTGSVAGPYAGQLLGDLGATVIKVERPGSGDDCRAWGPPFLDEESLWYLSVNRNKQAITLDITAPAGHAALLKMVGKADIVLINVVGRVQRKLGIDHATFAATNPALIHVSITGFGLSGERADMPCYDLIAEGYSGVMDMTGEADGPPQKVGTPAADLLAGEDAALAAVAALVRRQRTGKGAAIDIALVESMTRFMAPRLLPHLGSGDMVRRSGGRDSVIAIYQAFETADLPLTLGLGNDGIWQRFWAALDDAAFALNPAYATNAQRRQHRAEIVSVIAVRLRERPRDEWLARFIEARVPAGPINRLDEIGADAALRRRGFLYAFERNGTRVPQIGLGIQFDGESESVTRPPPRMGADNHAVLGDWLGLPPQELEALAAAGII
jgi:crotonobetainyl-CoA:carnitine CoA-transferase CaiB-like acyl-CoA transferase